MNQYNSNTQNFQELIEKYLDGKTTLEEVKQLVNYYESFQEDNTWVEDLGPEQNIKNRMLINILEAIQEKDEDEVKIVPLYKRNIFKYGVAASLVLFVAFNFIFNKSNKLINDSNSKTTPVNNNIAIGTDKATLTLEDGTNIPLEKGENFVAKNLSSNGEEIIYKSDKSTSSEVVYNYLTIPRGGQYHVKLSDGSEVWLNSESKLKYPVNFIDGITREVELIYGEAYFDVSPSTNHNGSDFKVYHNQQEVQVLGTEFNIKAYKDEDNIYTTLVEGRVAVTNESSSVYLSPNYQAIVKQNSNKIEVISADVFAVTSWKNGVFSFNQMPLEKIMKILARWYDIDVVFININVKDDLFTGVLRKNQRIEDILSLIQTTNNIAYEIKNKTILFK